MKKVILPLFCILMGVTSVTAQKKTAAPAKIETQNAKLSAKDVIDTYIKALGGKDKLEAVKNHNYSQYPFCSGNGDQHGH
jgi:hypothetical protein